MSGQARLATAIAQSPKTQALFDAATALGYEVTVTTDRQIVDTTAFGAARSFVIVDGPCKIVVRDVIRDQETEWTAATNDIDESVEECLRSLFGGAVW